MRSLNLGIPASQYPEVSGKFEGVLFVLGSGRCLWADFLYASQEWPNHDVMCVNDPIVHFPGFIRHAYSNDVNRLPHLLKSRRPEYKKAHGPVSFVHSCRKGTQYLWPWPGHGTSSLNAVYTGLALGYELLVLCGIPLDDNGHYFDPPWTKSNFVQEVGFKGSGRIKYWSHAADNIFEGRVKAVSGRLKELLP